MSLELIGATGADPGTAVVDVGGGASRLAATLLERGWSDLTVLDMSDVALRAARTALGADAERVAWVRTDVLDWSPARSYGLWHDRAVFHFLTDPGLRERYVATASRALPAGGHLVIGTFAEDGPPTCSGLPVARYDAAALAAAFGPGFHLVADRRDAHRTPSGSAQPFTWVVLRRRG
jgi:SAM-dependent methyltransferase